MTRLPSRGAMKATFVGHVRATLPNPSARARSPAFENAGLLNFIVSRNPDKPVTTIVHCESGPRELRQKLCWLRNESRRELAYLRCRILLRFFRFLRPILRRPLPVCLTPISSALQSSFYLYVNPPEMALSGAGKIAVSSQTIKQRLFLSIRLMRVARLTLFGTQPKIPPLRI